MKALTQYYNSTKISHRLCVIGFGKKIQNNFFNNAFLKTCQYVTLNEKVCKSLKYAFIKFAKENLEKCIT